MRRQFQLGIPDPDAVEQFVRAAGRKSTMPWQGPPPDMVEVQLNVRLPWKIMAMLDWLSLMKGHAKKDLAATALEEYLKRELQHLGVATE